MEEDRELSHAEGDYEPPVTTELYDPEFEYREFEEGDCEVTLFGVTFVKKGEFWPKCTSKNLFVITCSTAEFVIYNPSKRVYTVPDEADEFERSERGHLEVVSVSGIDYDRDTLGFAMTARERGFKWMARTRNSLMFGFKPVTECEDGYVWEGGFIARVPRALQPLTDYMSGVIANSEQNSTVIMKLRMFVSMFNEYEHQRSTAGIRDKRWWLDLHTYLAVFDQEGNWDLGGNVSGMPSAMAAGLHAFKYFYQSSLPKPEKIPLENMTTEGLCSLLLRNKFCLPYPPGQVIRKKPVDPSQILSSRTFDSVKSDEGVLVQRGLATQDSIIKWLKNEAQKGVVITSSSPYQFVEDRGHQPNALEKQTSVSVRALGENLAILRAIKKGENLVTPTVNRAHRARSL